MAEKDDAPRIAGSKEVLLQLRFGVPPGTDPVIAAQQLASGGIQISLGLVQYLRDARADVVDAEHGPKLHRPN